jgi:hypothetical protein
MILGKKKKKRFLETLKYDINALNSPKEKENEITKSMVIISQ